MNIRNERLLLYRCQPVAVRRHSLCAMARYSKACRSREEGTTSIARVYADINEKRPAEYWDYEALNVQVSAPSSARQCHL